MVVEGGLSETKWVAHEVIQSPESFLDGYRQKLLTSEKWVEWLAQDGRDILMSKGILNCSGLSFKAVTSHLAPLNTYVREIDVSNNPLLEKLPVESLCALKDLISTAMPSDAIFGEHSSHHVPDLLTDGISGLECKNCPLLLSPPKEVAQLGGEEVMGFLREVFYHGAFNTDMLLFLAGDGEASSSDPMHPTFSSVRMSLSLFFALRLGRLACFGP